MIYKFLSAAFLAALLALSVCRPCLAVSNGLALTPQMGWNSWNRFACNINETLIRQTADALVSSGLAAVGYNYLNLDDCWQVARDSNGVIIADPVAFPSGIPALVEYVHSLGLKFGLYSDAGEKTCQGRPGGLGHEVVDANTYAAWGVDYLKYDNCYNDNIKPETRYPPMSKALNQSGRPILFSMCEWGVDTPYNWAPQLANSWRTTGDISDNWNSMLANIDYNDKGWNVAGPGQWNDPDMLEVGNGGMNTTEYEAHFSLWALAKAPLIIGCDITNMSPDTKRILTNTEVIAINQDPSGVQGHKRISVDGAEVWAGPLSTGHVAVVLLNRNEQPTDVGFTYDQVGLDINNLCMVRDLWQHQDVGLFKAGFSATVPPHGVVMVTLAPRY